ncbi:MAG: CBS domain-containing protein [Solirubrobacterales bacterium]
MGRILRDVIKGRTVVTMAPDTSVRAAAKAMKANNVGSVVVVEGTTLKGIVTERDALFKVVAEGLDPDKTPLSAVMTEKVITVTAEAKLMHALHIMHDGGFRHMPVVDGDRPVGIVSIRDAFGDELARFGRELDRKEAILAVR